MQVIAIRRTVVNEKNLKKKEEGWGLIEAGKPIES